MPQPRRVIAALTAIALVLATLVVTTAPVSAAPLTFTVDTTRDLADATPGDGVCDVGDGTCSLRAAVTEANLNPDPDSIELLGQRYPLDDQLRITDDLDIVGLGMGVTVLDAESVTYDDAADPRWSIDDPASAHRVLVIGGLATVSIRDLTVQGGVADTGGGIHVQDADATLERVELRSNAAVADPLVGPGPGNGGAVFVGAAGTSLTVVDSRFYGNAADNMGGAIHQLNGEPLSITGTVFDGNGAEQITGQDSNVSGTFRPVFGGDRKSVV